MVRPSPETLPQGVTLAAVLAERARREPDRVALRAKRLGVYRERTWAEFCELAACCALGLRAFGLRTGERAALVGDPREEWIICDLAVQTLGAVSVCLYPTWSERELDRALRETVPTVIVAEGPECLERLQPLLARLPSLKRLVILDAAATAASGLRDAVSFAQVLAAGREALGDGEAASVLEGLADELDPREPAVLHFTAGTTSRPKGAVLSQEGQLAGARALVAHYPALGRPGHRTVPHLPLAHVLGRQSAIALPLVSGVVPHFGENLEQLPQTFFETAPTVLFTVPRYLHRLASRIRTALGATGGLKRQVSAAALSFGRRYAEARRRDVRSHLGRVQNALFRWGVYRPILNKLGFDRLELVLCGGGPLGEEVTTFWHGLGVNLVQVYGLTEAGGVVAGQKSPFPEPSAPARVLGGVEVKLGPGGEVLVRGEHVYGGYAGPVEDLAETMGEHWLATGDLGALEEGGLRLLGRSSDVLAGPGGEKVLLSPLEAALRASPLVSEAVVVGEGQSHFGALIDLDREAAAQRLRNRGVSHGRSASLGDLPEVLELVGAEIDRANRLFSEGKQIRSFRILPAPLDPEGGLLTPLLVPKRRACLEAYRDLIDALYDSEGSPVAS